MLRHRGIAKVKKAGKLADRALAVDQLADDQKPVAVGERLQQIARLIRRPLHHFGLYFHTCVYTHIRIYRQVKWEAGTQPGEVAL